MKLRIRSHSIRFRLGPREVRTLLKVESLQETLRFGPGEAQILRYRLMLGPAESPMSARIDSSEIVISIPRRAAMAWADEDGLTLVGEQPVGDGQTLQILVEKDLQCLESTAGPDEDVYPNPSSSCV